MSLNFMPASVAQQRASDGDVDAETLSKCFYTCISGVL